MEDARTDAGRVEATPLGWSAWLCGCLGALALSSAAPGSALSAATTTPSPRVSNVGTGPFLHALPVLAETRASERPGPRLEIEQSVGALGNRKPHVRLFSPSQGSGWALQDTLVRLGLADERIRLEARHAESAHQLAPSDGLQADGIGRLWAPGAISHRIEADVFEQGGLSSSLFAVYRESDEDFGWAAAPTRRKAFVAPGRRLFQGGGSFGLGPAVLSISRSLETPRSADVAPGQSRIHETTRGGLSLALQDLWPEGLPDRVGPAWLSPSSVWLSFADGNLRSGDVGASDPTRTRDLAFGASWDHGRSSASASFWSSEHAAEQSYADWEGSGVDAGYGFYADRWGVFFGLNKLRSHGADALESSLNGSLTLFLYPEQLPRLSASLDRNEWESRYGSSEPFSARTHGLELGVDLTRYLQREGFASGPRLEASYRLQHTTGASANVGFGHTIALSVDLSF